MPKKNREEYFLRGRSIHGGEKVHCWKPEERGGMYDPLCTIAVSRLHKSEIKFVDASEAATCKLCLKRLSRTGKSAKKKTVANTGIRTTTLFSARVQVEIEMHVLKSYIRIQLPEKERQLFDKSEDVRVYFEDGTLKCSFSYDAPSF